MEPASGVTGKVVETESQTRDPRTQPGSRKLGSPSGPNVAIHFISQVGESLGRNRVVFESWESDPSPKHIPRKTTEC